MDPKFNIDDSIQDLDKGLKDIFRWAYLRNADLEDEEIGQEDRETLEDLDTLEILENFKDLVKDLLSEKELFKSLELEQLRSTNQKFEGLIQKLEAEARQHVRTEQTLKVHIDSMATRIEELESQVSNPHPTSPDPSAASGKTTVKHSNVDTVRQLRLELEKERRKSITNSEMVTKVENLERFKVDAKRKISELELELEQFKTMINESGSATATRSTKHRKSKAGHVKHFSIGSAPKPLKPPNRKAANQSPVLNQYSLYKQSFKKRMQSYDLRKSTSNFDDMFKPVPGDRSKTFHRQTMDLGADGNQLMISHGKGVLGGASRKKGTNKRAKTVMKFV